MLLEWLQERISAVLFMFSRVAAVIILPAQIPGNITGLLNDITEEPLATITSWSGKLVRSILKQLFSSQKLQVPDDTQLVRLQNARKRYLEQNNWEEASVTTDDGLALDALLREPPSPRIPPRYILFVGGNFQKYEDWLPYFDLYARNASTGFFCFNFRGVGRSEGAVCCADDLIVDLRACVDHLLERGVQEDHLLIHGFSLGGAVAAIFLAGRQAPAAAFVSDRSFRTLSLAAYGLIRSPSPSGVSPGTDSDDEHSIPPTRLERAKARLEGWARVIVAGIAVSGLRFLAWELSAEAAWPGIQGKKVLLYHRSDNVVHYRVASLHNHLQRAPLADSKLRVVEVTRMGSNGWPMHDFPLCADEQAWEGLLDGVDWALGLDGRR